MHRLLKRSTINPGQKPPLRAHPLLVVTVAALTLLAGTILPGSYALANCQDLLGESDLFNCRVKVDDGGRFSDCFRFTNPGAQSENFDLSLDLYPSVLGCDCKAAGTFASPAFGESNSFHCVGSITEGSVPPFGLAFDAAIKRQGRRIVGEGVNDTGTSFFFRCSRVPTCEVPATVQRAPAW